MLWVIVIVAVDGTVSAMGTKSGRPFTSYASAERAASPWVPVCQVEVVALEDLEVPK